MTPGLIFDIGMHKGLDTEFYLNKGFKVVAVEANPVLAAEGQSRFASQIASGQLVIENVGIAQAAGTFPFYRNLENDEWSSFSPAHGARAGSKHEIIQIQATTATALILKHGMPYYMKVDIEGMDWLPVAALSDFSTRPAFVSVEDNSFQSLIQLHNKGAKAYKFIDQIEKWKDKPPNPPLEGSYVETTFGKWTSGLFGKELPGDWLPLDAAAKFYLDNIRPPGAELHHWWDIHARFD